VILSIVGDQVPQLDYYRAKTLQEDLLRQVATPYSIVRAAQSSDDLAAVGVAGDNGRAVLARQHLAQPGNVSGQRGLRELGRGYLVPVGLQALDDRAPAGPVGPRAVDEDDIRPDTHQWLLPG
jgi:hypothetical protein